jgi:2-phosphoglycolate phosphatase
MSIIPAPPQAVLFDLDGTLVDTADEFVVVVQALRAEHNLGPMDADVIRSLVSNGSWTLVKVALGMNESHPELAAKRGRLLELYTEVLGTVAKPYPGITDLLAELARRDIPWGLVTNKPRAYAEPLMETLNFNPAPACMVCPDDVTDTKPHPEPLYLACKQIDCLPHRCIYVGDHARDIDAGRGAGMYTIAACYGYIEAGDDPSKWGADASVEHSTELLSALFQTAD